MRLVWLLPATLVMSCAKPRPPKLSFSDTDELELAARAVDQLQWYVDAYGGAGMSSPLLVQPDDTFKFNLSMTADQFFAAERDQISGRVAGAVSSARVIGASVAGSADITGMQQYSQALADFQRNRAVVDQKQRILDDAAYRQYYAAIVASNQIADPVGKANAQADAAKQYAAALSGPGATDSVTAPTAPTPPALPTVASVPNAAAALLPSLAAPQGLYASGTPGVTGETRAATLMAAGDVATSAMLSALLDPGKLSSLSGKSVMWGVSMVAVNPGWKTRKGYSVNLEGDVTYTWQWARPDVRNKFIAMSAKSALEAHALGEIQKCVVDSLPYAHPDGTPSKLCAQKKCRDVYPFTGTAYASWTFRGGLQDSPVVAAASPMGDAQALDLQSSSRTIRESALQMAFALTTAGFNAQGSSFLNFAKSKDLDSETRTSNVVVSAYSSNGGQFGFQFNPRVVADPASGGKAQALQVPTFPTLLVIGMNANELHARVVVSDGRCFVVEPQLEFHTSSRWTRTDAQCIGRRDRESPCHGEELTEEETFVAARSLETHLKAATRLLENTDDDNFAKKALTRLAARADHLENYFGSAQPMWLPADIIVPGPDAPKKPAITLAAPTTVDLLYDESGALKSQPVVFTIAGTALDQVDLGKVAGPGAVTAKLANSMIQLSFTADKVGTYVFVLPLKDGSALATPPLLVRAPNLLVVGHTKVDPDGKTSKDTLMVTPGTPVDVIKSEIEKNKILPADVKVELDTHASAKGAK